ncbi:MAG: class I SAM-dependent methyltransferase [Chloroflexi bacterium]|nr:class I SAM-dependent methyltransferase [Chloroflexota bacterium]
MTETSAFTRSPHFGRDATAATYRDIHLPRVFTPWARVLLEIVPPRAGERVLDVATGPGTVAREAAKLVGPDGSIKAVDISAAMLAVGRDWPPEPGAAPIDYIEAPATEMPLNNEAFDVAYCQQGLQHMADPYAALQEIKRLLKPGGRLGVALWQQSPFGLFRQAVAELGLPESGPQPSDFGRDPAALAQAIHSAGFQGVQVQSRQLVSILEGGIQQGLQVAIATSAAARMQELRPEQQEAVRAVITRALEPLVQADGVHLTSIANIASAQKPS